MNRRFADISSNDAGFDAARYAAWGAVVVAIKVTEGLFYVNPFWEEWARDAHRHGIAVIFYHFARPGSGAEQARFFLDELHRSGIYDERHGDGIALDLERMGEVPAPEAFLKQFESVCRGRGHHGLVLYSEQSYLEEHRSLRTRRLWVAAYPQLVHGFRGRVWAHQYTDHEWIPGIGVSDCSFLSMRAYLWHRLHRPRRRSAMNANVPIGPTTWAGFLASAGSFATALVLYLTGSHGAQETQAIGAAVSGLVFGSITLGGRYLQAHKAIGAPVEEVEHLIADAGVKLPDAEQIAKMAAAETVKLLPTTPAPTA